MQNMQRVCIYPLGIILSFFVFFSVFHSSCSVHAVDSNGEKEMITVTGKIRLVGNEPFTHLVITTDDGKDYLVQGDLEKKLRALQHQQVTATGTHLKPKGEFKYLIRVKEYTIIDRAQ